MDCYGALKNPLLTTSPYASFQFILLFFVISYRLIDPIDMRKKQNITGI